MVQLPSKYCVATVCEENLPLVISDADAGCEEAQIIVGDVVKLYTHLTNL